MMQKNAENANTLDVLLKVESEASALVNDAQDEADKRIKKSEEDCRAAFEERCKTEIKLQEEMLVKNHNKVKNDYKNQLDSFRQELLQINVNKEQFRALINKYLDKRE